ncbi:heterokaryon incompatibility protein-domain-containing protein [Xylariaceae sp. FL0804]|nr:heterokaryon incompatibility protein-domain-containing protein [Xylariaceae sp. FL0804]
MDSFLLSYIFFRETKLTPNYSVELALISNQSPIVNKLSLTNAIMALCALCSMIPYQCLPPPPDVQSLWSYHDDLSLSMLDYFDFDPIGFPYHESTDALAASRSSCPLCNLIYLSVHRWLERFRDEAYQNWWKQLPIWPEDLRQPPEPMTAQRLWVTKRYVAHQDGGHQGFLVFARSGIHHHEIFMLAAVGLCVPHESPLAKTYPLRPRQPYSGSLESLATAASWLKTCLVQHPSCDRSKDTQLPSRVLDLGATGDTVRLIKGGAGSLGRYIALSYCWGTACQITTTHDTLESRQAGIAMQELPQTMLDAIALSRYLSVRYLWIDSLCIIQDDADDWALESSRMVSVYSNACLVVAADRGKDSTAGCFHTRAHITRGAEPVTLPGSNHPVHAELFSLRNETIFNGHPGALDGPLLGRGWALQERYLAQRVLHYTNEQMCFECNEGIIGEDGYREKRVKVVPNDLQVWLDLVREFSRRDLTKKSDRLPAIGGIASLFSRELKASYLAGHWSDTLIQGLTWRAVPRREAATRAPRKAAYVAPSWSWASAGCLVDPEDHSAVWEDIATLKDWHVELKTGNNPFGEVANAWICLHAPMAQLFPSDQTYVGASLPLRTAYYGELSAYFDDGERETRSGRMDMQLLLLGRVPRGENDEHGYTWTYGIVVMPVEGAQREARMKRIGLAAFGEDEIPKMVDDESCWKTVVLV